MLNIMYMYKITFVFAIVIAAAFIIFSAGCVDNQETPAVVYVGSQNLPDCLTVAIAEEYLEEEMGVTVEIVTLDTGRDITNALMRGTIQFGDVGTVPAAVAAAEGLDADVVWVNRVLGSSEALIAKDSANIQTVADLRGKTVATPSSSTAQYSLLQALKLYGVNVSEVTILEMPAAAIVLAWKVGDIDAAYIWNPTLAEVAELGGSHIVIDSAELAKEGVVTADITLVSSEFSKKYPELTEGFVRAMDRAVLLYEGSKDEAVSACGAYLNTDAKTVQSEMEGGIWLSAKEQTTPAYLGTSQAKGNLARTLKETGDYLFSMKVTASAPELSVFEKMVNPGYAEKIV